MNFNEFVIGERALKIDCFLAGNGGLARQLPVWISHPFDHFMDAIHVRL